MLFISFQLSMHLKPKIKQKTKMSSNKQWVDLGINTIFGKDVTMIKTQKHQQDRMLVIDKQSPFCARTVD